MGGVDTSDVGYPVSVNRILEDKEGAADSYDAGVKEESSSFGAVGCTGHGLTETYSASRVDMLISPCTTTFCAMGGFCAGSNVVVDHQRIKEPYFVFSATMPALLAGSGSKEINIFQSTPSIFRTLQKNVRAILDKVEYITVPSHPALPLIHIQIKHVYSPAASTSNALSSPLYSLSTARAMPLSPPLLTAGSLHPLSAAMLTSIEHTRDHHEKLLEVVDTKECLLQKVVDECLGHKVMATKAKSHSTGDDPQSAELRSGLHMQRPTKTLVPSSLILTTTSARYAKRKEVAVKQGLTRSQPHHITERKQAILAADVV
ncbi:hypothetical protein EST38_g9355 [Candolleomyces aberdarensis]|uniref:Uncharacterized protein n=1 Tax=Candolleomyces aberdarensis TaxID=2316362 RepID=A0A4Q2DD27_9AGAR|nr:hypothetical protein EST38_g9355 [Candolleomyces aberdarensis]